MNHKYFSDLVYLSFTGEISDKLREELKVHMLTCSTCRKESEQLEFLEKYLSAKKTEKVSGTLLADARNELNQKLRIAGKKEDKLSELIEKIREFFSINYKYVLNGAICTAAGIVIGFLLFKGSAPEIPAAQNISSVSEIPGDVSYIRNIHLIDVNPADDNIEFSFEAVRNVRMSGSVSDEKMRSVLMYAVMNGNNPGVRLNSLNALNSAVNISYDNEIKDAIISAVKYDDNPGVRREALKVLKNLPFDQDIKRAYLYAILNDTSSGIRIEAINELIESANKGTSLSSEEKELFRERLLEDHNGYIRLRAKTVLEEYN